MAVDSNSISFSISISIVPRTKPPKRRNMTYFPMQSANVCGNSCDCFLLLSIGAASIDFICIGLNEMSRKAASAALAAAFFANFFDGPVTNEMSRLSMCVCFFFFWAEAQQIWPIHQFSSSVVPVPSNFWLLTVATILKRECCTPSVDTQSICTSVNNSYSSMTGPLSGVCFLLTTVLLPSFSMWSSLVKSTFGGVLIGVMALASLNWIKFRSAFSAA